MWICLSLALSLIATSSSSHSHQSPSVEHQYTEYPYPPTSTAPQIFQSMAPPILQAPSHLAAINHYIFHGQKDWCSPVKILVAGGGTGEKTVQLIHQFMASQSTSNWKITHLDLSHTSVAIAQKRVVQMYGQLILTHVHFVVGSLLQLNDLLPYQKFDYIDCLGVLHTLKAPSVGLSMLNRALKPDGGIGIMVYAPIGRAGIINMQSMMQLLSRTTDAAAERSIHHHSNHSDHHHHDHDMPSNINLTKSILRYLPATNPLKIDTWRWSKLSQTLYNTTKESGLVDLFLPAHDVPMTVNDVYQLVQQSHMHLESFIHSALYKLETYIHDPVLLHTLHQRLPTRQAREHFVEMLSGNMFHHFFFATKQRATQQKAARTWKEYGVHMIPIPVRFNGKRLGRALQNLTFYPWKNNNLDLYFRLPHHGAVQNVLALMDGKRSIRMIQQECGLAGEDFERVFGRLYEILNSQGKLFLSLFPATFEELSQDELQTREALYPGVPQNGWHYFDCRSNRKKKGEQ